MRQDHNKYTLPTSLVGKSLPISTVISEALEKVSVSTTFAQSWLVLASTSSTFLGLEESQS